MGLADMQTERSDLEKKNYELGEAFREKSVNQQKIQKMYQQLKAQVMARQVVDAAGDEADLAIYSTRSDRFINKIPGMQSSASNLPHLGANRRKDSGKHYTNGGSGSGSSGSNDMQRGEFGFDRPSGSQLHGRTVGGIVNNRSKSLQAALFFSKLPSFINASLLTSFRLGPVRITLANTAASQSITCVRWSAPYIKYRSWVRIPDFTNVAAAVREQR